MVRREIKSFQGAGEGRGDWGAGKVGVCGDEGARGRSGDMGVPGMTT